LLLLLSTILGFVLSGDQRLQQEVLTSALHQFPLIGQDLAQPRHLGGGPAGLVVGMLGSLYGGLVVAQAFQYAMNTMWAVPRDQRPNPFKARGRSLLLLFTAGLAVMGTTALSIVGGGGAAALGVAGRYLVLAASLAINIAVSIFAFRFAPARRLSVRDVVPGAIASALIWQLLQSFGVIYVRHVIEHASVTNAVFAIVLGLLAFLYITPGDRRVYSRQAKAQPSKGPAGGGGGYPRTGGAAESRGRGPAPAGRPAGLAGAAAARGGAVAQIRQKLSAAQFDQAFSAGSALTQRQAIDIVQDQRGTGTQRS
jgi:hypothetical protein